MSDEKKKSRRPKHRFVLIGGSLWRMSEKNHRGALQDAVEMKSVEIELDPKAYRMKRVSDYPVQDWTNLNSAMAEMYLTGKSQAEAKEVGEMQAAAAYGGDTG